MFWIIYLTLFRIYVAKNEKLKYSDRLSAFELWFIQNDLFIINGLVLIFEYGAWTTPSVSQVWGRILIANPPPPSSSPTTTLLSWSDCRNITKWQIGNLEGQCTQVTKTILSPLIPYGIQPFRYFQSDQDNGVCDEFCLWCLKYWEIVL